MKHILEKKVADATPLELLAVLLHTQGLSPAARQTVRVMPAQEATVGIGDDATASIVIFDDDLAVLNELTAPR